MDITKSVIIFGLAAVSSFAAKYEGESATLSEGAKSVNSTGVSGTGYADMQEGNITFTGVTAESAGKYLLTVHYKAGDDKVNYLKVNGASVGSIDFKKTSDWADVSTPVTLKAGTNSIALEKFWGWISVDYISIDPYQSQAFNLSATPVTKNPTGAAQKLYSFLRENFGKKTISGMMTGDMTAYTKDADFKTHDDAKDIYNRSGKYPALMGVDFLFASGPNASTGWNMEYTEKAVSLAKNLWKQGGIPAFTWHWKDPLDQKDAFYIQSAANGGEYTDFNFATGFKSGSTEWDTESAAYKGIVADIDHIADYFLELQKDSVAAIFRPLHEAGGKWFWWSINNGKQFAALYRLVFDRMVNVKGVRNLVWVYNPESGNVTDWDPGKEYYDVISIDIYANANNNSSQSSAFDKYKEASGGTKIIALTENGPIPDVNNMHTDEAVWSWWMPWYSTWSGTWTSQTSNALWKSNMEDERIITFEDMPGWDKYTPSNTPATPSENPTSSSDPASSSSVTPGSSSDNSGTTRLATPAANIFEKTTVGVFNMNGHFICKDASLANLASGRYIVRSKVGNRIVNQIKIKY